MRSCFGIAWRAIAILLVWAVGALLGGALVESTLGSSGPRIGVGRVYLRWQATVFPEDWGNFQAFNFHVESTSKLKFYLSGSSEVSHRTVTVVWNHRVPDDETPAELKATFLFDRKIIIVGDTQHPLTREVFRELVMKNESEFALLVTDTVFNLVQDAGEGRAKPPNHHGHPLPKPLMGKMSHHLNGVVMSIPGWLFLALWAWIVGIFVKKGVLLGRRSALSESVETEGPPPGT